MKKSSRFFRLAEWVACLGLGAIFLLSSISKLRDPLGFALAIDQFQLLPEFLINPVAVFLPWIECVLALALWFVPSLRRDALLLCGLLLAGFTAVLLTGLLQGREIFCGCFGSASGPVTWWEIARNTAMLALIILGLSGRPLEKRWLRRRHRIS
jgi:putative oxidoreductase